jgi:sulfatase maturation enzyme AslB (radical SAM superfamily)
MGGPPASKGSISGNVARDRLIDADGTTSMIGTTNRGLWHVDGWSAVGYRFGWLELTGKCQLQCVHCYADSGPSGDHGSMTAADWRRVLDEAAGLGVGSIQFIGGEPTLHPALPGLLVHARRLGLAVEVYSNLVHMSPELWDLLSDNGIRLACSYYSDDPAEHARITGRRGSHARTRANIAEAVRRDIPVRVGVIAVDEDQRVEQATAELMGLGVASVGRDRLRQVGRGIRDWQPGAGELCGRCGDGVFAVGADGSVWPCVFSRWMPVGSVHTDSLAAVLSGREMRSARDRLGWNLPQACVPMPCTPTCTPNCAPNDCRPWCKPADCVPNG